MDIINQMFELKFEIEKFTKEVKQIQNKVPIVIKKKVFHLPTLEKELFLDLIKKYPHSKRKFQAETLGIPQRTFYEKIKKYNLINEQ